MLAALQGTVGDGTTAISREKIFPVFKELAEAHQQTVAWLQKAESLPRLWEMLRAHVGKLLFFAATHRMLHAAYSTHFLGCLRAHSEAASWPTVKVMLK